MPSEAACRLKSILIATIYKKWLNSVLQYYHTKILHFVSATICCNSSLQDWVFLKIRSFTRILCITLVGKTRFHLHKLFPIQWTFFNPLPGCTKKALSGWGNLTMKTATCRQFITMPPAMEAKPCTKLTKWHQSKVFIQCSEICLVNFSNKKSVNVLKFSGQ